MTGERADQDYDIKSVAEILHRHVDTEREYANYWKFSLDRKIEEQHIAAYYLTTSKPMKAGPVRSWLAASAIRRTALA